MSASQGDETTLAKFAHLREEQRQVETEQRGRAEVTDTGEES